MVWCIIVGYDVQLFYDNLEISIPTIFFLILINSIGIWNAIAYGLLLRKKYELGNYAFWSKDTTLIDIILG